MWVKDPNADLNPCPKGCERGKRLQLDEHKSGDTTEYQANYECYLPQLAVPQPALKARATATQGLLLVNSNPQRAKVYVDDVYYGLSPLRVSMDPGIHVVSVKLDGYRMVTEKVSVRKGDNTEVELNLER